MFKTFEMTLSNTDENIVNRKITVKADRINLAIRAAQCEMDYQEQIVHINEIEVKEME